jgi:succinoglycan biosynthesis transport protein ExoP
MATLPERLYPTASDAGGAAASGLPLRELLTILRRRRRVIFVVVALLTSVATLIGLKVTRTYTATALVMLEPRENHIVDVRQVAEGLGADAASVESQIKVIESRDALRRTVDALNLLADPAFLPSSDATLHSVDGALSAFAALLPEGIAKRLPESWLIATGLAKEAAAEPDDLLLQMRAMVAKPDLEVWQEWAVDVLQAGLSVTQSGGSYVLAVNYTATDPQLSAVIANGIASAYIEGQRDHKLEATKHASAWLNGRVEELRKRVLETEEAVQAYRAGEGLVEDQVGTLDAQELAALNAQLIGVRAERTTNEANLRQLQELRSSGWGYESSIEVMSSPLVMSLRQRELDLLRQEAQLSKEYGKQHPSIVQLQAEKDQVAEQIDVEIQKIISSLKDVIAVARAREQGFEDSLAQAKSKSSLTDQASLKLRDLEREAAANRSLYEAFLSRLKQTEEQQQIVQEDARVISPAQAPGSPSSPSPKLFAAVGFTASLVLGSVLALLLEQLDNGVRHGRQVEQLLQVPSFGLVPKVTGMKRGQRLHRYLLDQPRSAYAEGVRALYTRIHMANVNRPFKVILVTSALPGEGKTSLSISLAVFAAQLQRKVLLVGLDLRRPRLAKEFDLHPEVSAVEMVASGALLAEVVCRNEHTGVDVLADAHSHSNLTAVLTSRHLSAVLGQARARYDLVIIDTPPVLGVSDAKVLVPHADAVAFVVQWEKTKRDAAQAALKELSDVRANVIGAVLNQVDMKRHASYGYGDAGQYYHKYALYYKN